MSGIKGPGGELRATIHITRKATGKVETYEIIGHTNPEDHARILKLIQDGHLRLEGPVRNEHGSSGALIGPGAEVNQEKDP